jgi:hypothetical protein
MTKIALVELNALRVAQGMKPLKAWKESKEKLTAAIDKLRAEQVPVASLGKDNPGIKPVQPEPAKPKSGSPGPKLLSQLINAPFVEARKAKTNVAKETLAAVAKNDKSGDFVSIRTIADKLNMSHKRARASCRRHHKDMPAGVEGSQYWFHKSEVPAVEAILQRDNRKKS